VIRTCKNVAVDILLKQAYQKKVEKWQRSGREVAEKWQGQKG